VGQKERCNKHFSPCLFLCVLGGEKYLAIIVNVKNRYDFLNISKCRYFLAITLVITVQIGKPAGEGTTIGQKSDICIIRHVFASR
jgi:hypothetical protein